MRRLVYLLPIGVLAVLTIFFVLGLQRDPKILPSVLIDKPAPEFVLHALKDGAPGLATGDLQGDVTLVNFFASWCIPCRAEHGLLMELTARKQLRVIGINYKDKKADALRWLAELGDPYQRIGADGDGRVAIDWGVYGVPESYLLDRTGRIRFKQVGPLTANDVATKLLPLVKELSK